jgi:hypothetical protein
MPFCRKCGRRLPEYSESCPDCGTSTTAVLIKIKKKSAPKITKADAPAMVAQAFVPAKAPIRVFSSAKLVKKAIPVIAAKPVAPANVRLKHKDMIAKFAKTAIPRPPKKIELKKPSKIQVTAQKEPYFPSKPVVPAVEYPPHEIMKSNLSIEEDIITNPHDYETQIFEFDLSCPNRHFWRAGRALPVSNGKAYCPKCGEQLRKPKSKRKPRYHKY